MRRQIALASVIFSANFRIARNLFFHPRVSADSATTEHGGGRTHAGEGCDLAHPKVGGRLFNVATSPSLVPTASKNC